MTRHHHHRLVLGGLSLVVTGSWLIALASTSPLPPFDPLITLPVLLISVILSGRQHTQMGINRAHRQVQLSAVGHFYLAAAIFLPIILFPVIAGIPPTHLESPSSWMTRCQRLLTMNVVSFVFWRLTAAPTFSIGGLVDRQVFLAVFVAMLCHLAINILSTALILWLMTGSRHDLLTLINYRSCIRDLAEVSIGSLGVICAMVDPILLIFVIPMCLLVVEHLRVTQSAHIAKRDSRTKLLNALGLSEFVDHEFTRAHRLGTNLCVIILDLDFLRDVNNTHGHQVGDQAINSVATQLSTLTRSIDAAARIGGEEFVLVLPDTKIENAVRIADRIRVAVENSPITTGGQAIRITISAGVAQLQQQETYAEIFDRADRALYESKKQGRNRITRAHSQTVEDSDFSALNTFQISHTKTN